MTLERTPVDRLVQPAVERVAARGGGYFKKSEVVQAITKERRVSSLLTDLRTRHGAWKIDQLILRYIDGRVGHILQMRDANGIRVYECYAAGEKERRWMPLRAMTANTLRAVMQETRTQARYLTIKGEGYQYFLTELEKLGEEATVEDVYDKVIGRIQTYRASA
jgi:hypothetical protein